MSWLDDRIAKDIKDPKFKDAWEKYAPEHEIIQYMLDNNIPFTQEFLNILDELTEKGLSIHLVPIEKTDSDRKTKKFLETA